MASLQPPPTWRDAILAAAIFLVVFHVFHHSPVRYMGDSKWTLLLTNQLLTKGSFILDDPAVPRKTALRVNDAFLDGDVYQVEIVGPHLYNYFPPGSAVLSAPFVWIGNALGHSIYRPPRIYDARLEASDQGYIASLLMAVLAVIFYYTARLLLPVGWSAGIALGGVMGTQAWSTASRALWTHTWGIALLGSILYLLLAQETGRRRLSPILLATLLSWTYFVRPTNSLFIIGITVYLLLYHRALFVPYAATGAAWLLAFVVYSWTHFHHLLPSYYQANRLATTTFWEAVSGNLISPSRGTLVYVPIIAFVVFLVVRYRAYVGLWRLVVLTVAVGAAHLAVVSCFTPWFGGWCYGPRYTTELVPWFVLLAVLGARAALDRREDYALPRRDSAWRVTLATGGFLMLLSVWINGRGAISTATSHWNSTPVGLDYDPGRVWDWRHPQFLAGLVDPPPDVFPVLPGRTEFGYEGDREFAREGWSEIDPKVNWTDELRARLVFAANDLSARRLRLRFGTHLHPPALPRQRVVIRLDGQRVADLIVDQPDEREYTFDLPAGVLQRRNVLTFDLPDARSPKSCGEGDDDRRLGIALRSLEIL